MADAIDPPCFFCGYVSRVRLGNGKMTYVRGRKALLQWKMHDGSSWAGIKLGRRLGGKHSLVNCARTVDRYSQWHSLSRHSIVRDVCINLTGTRVTMCVHFSNLVTSPVYSAFYLFLVHSRELYARRLPLFLLEAKMTRLILASSS